MKAVGAVLALAAVMMMLGVGVAMGADPKPVEGAKNEQGLTAGIVVNTATYTLNPAQQGQAFRDSIDRAKNLKNPPVGPPKPPVVDLTLRITNTTDKDVTIRLGGDESRVDLKLEGPGAVTVENAVAMTMDFKIGNPVTIAAGKSYDMKINSLAFGNRGISQYAYWTEPGEYTLTATLVYPVGEKQTTVVSGGAKLTVEAAK